MASQWAVIATNQETARTGLKHLLREVVEI